MELTLTNALVVTADEVFRGSVHCKGPIIAAVDRGISRIDGAVDLAGDFLLPGLIDVHTDNLERHSAPRAGARWDHVAAAVSHDRDLVAGGIATVFDSVCVGESTRPGRKELMAPMLSGIHQARARGLLQADHRIHLRCDLMEAELPSLLQGLSDLSELHFISMLDDSASRHLHRFRRRLLKRPEVNPANIEEEMERRMREPDPAPANRSFTMAFAASRNVAIADHDDTAAWQVEKAQADGIKIIEFPITIEAAEAAHRLGLVVIAGAPNFVRGTSHSGNASVADLVERGYVDILCSDYVPSSLMSAVFKMAKADPIALLPGVTAMASRVPAETFGLADRGAIAPGMRADLACASLTEDLAIVRSVWLAGTPAMQWARPAMIPAAQASVAA